MKTISFLYIFAFSLLFSCSDDPSESGDLMIRVQNVSNFDYKDVFVNTSGGEHNFGDIDSKETSDYVEFESAYRYAFIELEIEGETFTIQPIDYVGEEQLEPGEYTYQVNALENGDRFTRLTLELKED